MLLLLLRLHLARKSLLLLLRRGYTNTLRPRRPSGGLRPAKRICRHRLAGTSSA